MAEIIFIISIYTLIFIGFFGFGVEWRKRKSEQYQKEQLQKALEKILNEIKKG